MDMFRILVVDDEVDFLETIVNRLQKRKLNASGVTSGEEAVELLQKELFDVVILDIKMPGGMDGIDTLREIKKIQPLVEVILLTVLGAEFCTVSCYKASAYQVKIFSYPNGLTKHLIDGFRIIPTEIGDGVMIRC